MSNQNKIYVNLKLHKISIISSQCSEKFCKNTKVTNYNMKPIKGIESLPQTQIV